MDYASKMALLVIAGPIVLGILIWAYISVKKDMKAENTFENYLKKYKFNIDRKILITKYSEGSPKRIYGSMNLFIDEKTQRWFVQDTIRDMTPIIYNGNDIYDVQLYEDGYIKRHSGIGDAIVGGMLFGAAGAIVGALTKTPDEEKHTALELRVIIKGQATPLVLPFLDSEGCTYKEKKYNAEILMTTLIKLKENRENFNLQEEQTEESSTVAISSITDEIKRFKDLLDCGAITQEEFDTKKKQLLGI